jgi:hypothetical protein
MEELSAMMYANQYVREQRYDVVVLGLCANGRASPDS